MRASLPPVLAAIALLSTACPQSIDTTSSDTGSEPEDARADSGSGPTDAETHPDADSTDGGSTDAIPNPNPDGGSTDALPADIGPVFRPFAWGEMTLPPNTSAMLAIGGRSATEVYAGNGSGNVYALDPINGWQPVWHEPSNFGIHKIACTPAKIFIASESSLFVHNGQIQQSPAAFSVGHWINDMSVASDTEVYLVADQQNGRGLYKYDGTRIVPLAEPTNIATLGSVLKVPGGPLLVGGNGAIFHYAAATLTPETVEWPAAWGQNDILNFTFWTIGAVGNDVYAGGDRHLIFKRDGTTWRLVYQPFYTDNFQAIVGFDLGDRTEAYAAGGNTSHGPLAYYFGGTWQPDPYSANVDLNAIYAPSPDEYFIAGNVDNSFDGLILHGMR